ncbi:Bacteriophage abortive infection AbiH [Chitinophaga jiangningensis]|uniref:Bacteriophage abortive infection AbiH n=1 Tax=Chitinophaga jiangningensis TaxID=1419482 RepID=A0A1M7A2N8_9BACT|nr:Bacteriophage abortive infection AbiH [Chitinophaga jiangningensis]
MEINRKYEEIFSEMIKKEEISKKLDDNLPDEFLPASTMILNFNYTCTVEQYLTYFLPNMREVIKVNYIHGQLNNPENPLIFGFGDDYDRNYEELEESPMNELKEHLKSFWYFRTENYHNLIKFIEADDYQVYIMGHSCGQSDKTMLKMIFEHPQCKAIKIYYHQKNKYENDFKKLTYEIARHFSNKLKMRELITPLKKCMPLPQANVINHYKKVK